MPEPHETGDRTPAQRTADHASLARLSETLVPALVTKLTGSGLGEVEVREGDWKIRVRRPVTGIAAPAPRRPDRPRLGAASHAEPRAAKPVSAPTAPEPDARRSVVTSPTVGIFRPGVAVGTVVRAGDRIAVVDLLGIPQDVAATIDGTLVEVFAQAGEAVEYGEEIAVVEAILPPEPASDGAAPAGPDGEG
jgi:acetyl-CoA carboxylase biotin carboxyl carrier protein